MFTPSDSTGSVSESAQSAGVISFMRLRSVSVNALGQYFVAKTDSRQSVDSVQ